MSTVLITGATSGLGAALVALYLNSGDHVIACGRNAQALALLKQNHGEQVDTRLFDITQPGAAAAALAAITEVDIAILNAGTCEYLDVDQFKAALVERVHAANFLGAVYCTEALKRCCPGWPAADAWSMWTLWRVCCLLPVPKRMVPVKRHCIISPAVWRLISPGAALVC